MMLMPPGVNAFEFVILASLRTHQLMGGCAPHLLGHHKATTMAQMEVAAGKVGRLAQATVAGVALLGHDLEPEPEPVVA